MDKNKEKFNNKITRTTVKRMLRRLHDPLRLSPSDVWSKLIIKEALKTSIFAKIIGDNNDSIIKRSGDRQINWGTMSRKK